MSEIVRVSPDGRAVIVRVSDSQYGLVAAGAGDVSFFESLDSARQGRHWTRPKEGSAQKHAASLDLVTAKLTELGVSEEKRSEKRRVYRVPTSVRDEAARGLRWAEIHGADAELLSLGRRLARSSSVGVDAAQAIVDARMTTNIDTFSDGYARASEGYPSSSRIAHALMGGLPGEAWANKLGRTHKTTIIASAFDFDGTCTYYASVAEDDTSGGSKLYMQRPDGTWAVRAPNAWEATDEIDPESLVELDEESATQMAEWVDDSDGMEVFDLRNVDPVERNVFDLGSAGLDYTMIERAVVAAGGIEPGADGYTPQERSQNAQRQARAQGGRFGSSSAAPTGPASKEATPAFTKARLPSALPLVPDVNALIEEYLASMRPAAAAPAEPVAAPPPPAEPVTAAGEAPAEGGPAPLYMAIVDQVDTEAVLDVISLVPADEGATDAVCYRRNGGAWVEAPELLADLRSTTPPAVVQLTDEAMIKQVLAQVDSSDASTETAQPDPAAPVEVAPSAAAPAAPVMASAYSLCGPNGELIPVYTPAPGTHLRSLVAAGVPGVADTPSDHAAVNRLQRYWSHGEGAAKVRWGTEGDLTRCHNHLVKYFKNSSQAWGFCQLRHHDALGTYNKD